MVETNKLIEKYREAGDGYHPFLIRDGWQVAQLNYDDNQKVENIKKLDVHLKTDEVFVLLKGQAVLITASIENNRPLFELELMKSGITYNVPQDVWHNIAMLKGSEVLIVEKSDTHLSDFEFFNLTEEQQALMVQGVNEIFSKNKKN
ncbi:MAG: hypothetical protein MI866_09030 [Bacteroidales bacterium]|nr:hypothetical protein [Bacteroidales bacterium]